MALSKLIKGLKSELLITATHEAWLSRNSNVELSEEVAEFVRSELLAKQRKRSQTWSSSSLGYCERKHVYQYMGAEKERGPDSDLANIFIHGTWTHLKWQAMGFMAGWLGQAEVPCAMPEVNYTGTIDGILADGVSGWELKSINARGFRYILDRGVKEEHKRQIMGYMLATGLRKWSVVYEEKDTQQWKEFVVDYDEALAASVLDEMSRLNHAVATRTLPVMQPDCIEKKNSTYKQCAYRDQCATGKWPGPTLTIRRKS